MNRNKLSLSVLLISLAALAAYCQAQQTQEKWRLTEAATEDGKSRAIFVQVNDRLGKFSEKWADADEDERGEMTDEAMAILSEQFDSDFEKREKAVEQLERRLAKLKLQLDRRASKKEQIVKLRLQQMTMNWEGLGWGDGRQATTGFPALWSSSSNNQSPFNHNHEGNIALQQAGNNVSQSMAREIVVGLKNSDLDMDEIRDAADEKVEQIVGKYLDSVGELEPGSANQALWDLVTEDDLELSNELWLRAAKIAEKAAGKIEVTDDPGGKANTLDTAAHLFHNGGDIDKALKLQELAVELNPNSQLQEYLRALKFTKKEMSID